MADAQIIINISAKDMASAVLKQLGTDIKDGIGKAGKSIEAFQKSLGEVGKTAGDLGKKMSVGVTAPLAAFGAVAVNSAVKAERLTKTLNGLAGGADEAAGYIEAIKTASLGTIPQVEALEIANRALSFGVVDTQEGMASLVETAIVLGKAQGLDAATAVSDLTTALSRQSPMILDNLGITLKMSEASIIAAENAHKFGLEADNLTKAQEFQIAALTKGQEAAAKMGGMQEDMATKAERAKAQMADLATQIGGSLIPVMQTGLDIITPIIQAFTNLDPAMQKVVIATAAMAAGVGPALSTFGQFATIASKLPTNMAALNTALGSTQVQLLAVTAAVVAVTAAFATYNAQQEKVNAATEATVAVADQWSGKAQAMIDDGGELEDVLNRMAIKTNRVSSEWNSNIVTGTALGAVFNTNAKIGKVYSQTQDEINKIAAKNTASFAEYQQAIAHYNDQISDGAAKVSAYTESQYEMASSGGLWADVLGVMTDAIAEVDIATAKEAVAVESSASARERHNRAVDDGTGKTMANAEATVAHMKAQQVAADVAVMQAAAAERQAAALEASRQAAIANAEAQLQLASSLKGATDAQIASALIEQLDPEQLGVTAYTEGVTAIQTAFGLADEKSIALSQSLGPLADAMNQGIVSADQFDEALAALVADAEDGQVNTGALIDEFARAPGLIGPSKDALDSLNEKLALTGELAKSVTGDVQGLSSALTGAGQAAANMPTPGAGPQRFQFGGVVPGPIGGPPRLVLAEPGERFIPPSQTRNVNNNFGNNTQNVTINDSGALGFFEEQQRFNRLSALSANL